MTRDDPTRAAPSGKSRMTLTRKAGDWIDVGDVRFEIVATHREIVRIRIHAPRSTPITYRSKDDDK